MLPRLIDSDVGATNPHFELMAAYDGDNPALLCTLDDRPELHQEPEYKAAWSGYLRLFQLLRHAPNAWFMTRSGSAEGDAYAPIAAMRGMVPQEVSWLAFDDIEPEFRRVARALMEAGVREPEVGMEIPDARNDVWAEAELVWEDERLALTSRALAEDARGKPAAGWTVFYLEDLADGGVESLLGALMAGASR
jgi:hypothetical protein